VALATFLCGPSHDLGIGQFEKSKLFLPLRNPGINTDRSRAEKLWLECGVIGDVMLCDIERDKYPGKKFDATIHSKKITCITIVLFCKR
jgi:hypothetical protein